MTDKKKPLKQTFGVSKGGSRVVNKDGSVVSHTTTKSIEEDEAEKKAEEGSKTTKTKSAE